MKVKDLCIYAPKSKIKAGEATENGKYMFFTSSSDESKRYDDFQLDCEGIIMGTGGNATLHYYNGKYSVSTDCIVLLPNDSVRCKYLYYYFLSHMKTLEEGFKGAGLKHTNKKYISDIEVGNIPNLETQNKIIYILDEISQIINQLKQQLDKLDELIKYRFVEMFGDAVDNPMLWEKKQLQEIVTDDCTISYGIVQTGDDQEEGVPVFRPVDIVNHIPKLEELKKTTEEISSKYKKTILKGREMLVTVRANIADTCIVGKEFKGCNVGRGIVPIRTQEDIMILEFLKYLMDSKHLNDYIKSKAKGITLIQLNIEDLRKIELIVPPIDLQNQFADFVKQVDKSKFIVMNILKILYQRVTL